MKLSFPTLCLLLALACSGAPPDLADVPDTDAPGSDAADVRVPDAPADADPDDTPPGPPGVLSLVLIPHPAMAVAALAHVVVPPDATHLSYAHAAGDELSDADEAPRVPVQAGTGPITLPLLGLAPGTANAVRVTAWSGSHRIAVSGELSVTTLPLPDGFPVVAVTTDDGSFQGTLLVSAVTKDRTAGWAAAFDRDGRPLWYHAIPRFDERAGDFQQGADGHLFVFSRQARGIEELRQDGERVRLWTDPGASLGLDGHDYHPLPDGRLLAIGRERLPDEALLADPEHLSDHEGVVGSTLDLLDAAGAVQLHVSAWPSFTPADSQVHVVIDGLVDFDHLNALAALSPTDVLASFAFLDSVARIDLAAGEVRWVLGGDRNEFRFVDDPEAGFSGQHSLQALPGGDVLLFDNGLERSPAYSRVVQYHLDEDTRTATRVWQYRATPDVFVRIGGAVQRLDDGTTLVGWSLPGRIEVVTPEGAPTFVATTSLPFYRVRWVASLIPAP